MLVGILLGALAAAIGFGQTPQISAQTLDQLKNQRQELNREIERNRQQVEQKKQEAKKLSEQIQKIDGDIAATQERIKATDAQLGDAKATIEVLNIKIADTQKTIDTLTDQTNELLRVMYETSDQNIVVLLAGSSVSDIVDRIAYGESLQLTLEQLLDESNRLKTDLLTQKKDQQDRQTNLEELKKKHEAYQSNLDQNKDRKENLLEKTKISQQEFEKKLEQAKRLSIQVENELSALARTLGQRGSAIKSKDLGVSQLGFRCPVDLRYITTRFGPTDSSYPFFEAIKFHSGVDLVGEGPVYAATDGVANLFNTSAGYGNYIVIGAKTVNASYATLYGHLQSFLVENGSEVKQGDLIGIQGTTGWSTGPHVHFEVWLNGDRVNPEPYLPGGC